MASCRKLALDPELGCKRADKLACDEKTNTAGGFPESRGI